MEESALRLLLVVVGICVLLGIFFYDKIKNQPKQENDFFDEATKVQPVISDDAPVANVVDETSAFDEPEKQDIDHFEAVDTSQVKPETMRSSAETVPVVKEAMVVQLVAVPNDSSQIQGVDLLNMFTQLNLEFGDMGIFHRYQREQGVETQLFHVANLMEPGTFPVGNMNDFKTKGLVFFFQANQSIEANASFDEMLESARAICQQFDCELMNADMQPLTFEKIDVIRDQLSNDRVT